MIDVAENYYIVEIKYNEDLQHVYLVRDDEEIITNFIRDESIWYTPLKVTWRHL